MLRFTVTILFVLITTSALSQQPMEDVVYLKDGSIVIGIIIGEYYPGGKITIETRDGSRFVYESDEILKIAKQPKRKASPPYIQSSPTPHLGQPSPATPNPNLGPQRTQYSPKSSLYPYRKSPGLAGVLSFIWPGAGQIYNEEGEKAATMIGLHLLGLVLLVAAVEDNDDFGDRDNDDVLGVFGLVAILGNGIYSIVDAVNSTQRINWQREQEYLRQFSIKPINKDNQFGAKLAIRF